MVVPEVIGEENQTRGKHLRSVCAVLWLVAPAAFGGSSAVAAAEMRATLYDDGLSCPGDCDAHVVFHRNNNGTSVAFAPPLASRGNPQPCRLGEPCVVCFGEDDDSCIETRFRGGGPPLDAFDFTPAFYREMCPREVLPETLRRKCDELGRSAQRLADRVNCFTDPEHEKCRELIAAAIQAKDDDRPFFEECRQIGIEAYNRRHAGQPERQRSLACFYELHGTGRNSAGVTWRRLLPAACGPDRLVGRDGLDCCSNDLLAAGGFGRECLVYFPEP